MLRIFILVSTQNALATWLLQADDVWTIYGESVKPVDCYQRQFTATFNRVKVMETAIVRTLQQSSCATDSAANDAQRQTACRSSPWQREAACGSWSDAAVMLNCSFFADDRVFHGGNMTATHLRQIFVSQHLHALLTDSRFVLYHQPLTSLCVSVCQSVCLLLWLPARYCIVVSYSSYIFVSLYFYYFCTCTCFFVRLDIAYLCRNLTALA